MTGELKNFPATDLKLERLRRSGVTPFSRNLMVAAAQCGCLIGLIWVLSFLSSDFAATAQSLWVEKAPDASFPIVASTLLGGARALLLPILASVLFVGAYQRRFLFGPHLARPRLARIFSLGSSGARYRRGLFMACVSLLVATTSLIALGGFSVGLFSGYRPNSGSNQPLGPFAEGLNAESAEALKRLVVLLTHELRESFLLFSYLALGFAVFLGIISRIAAVLLFNLEHRMSRAEIEAEFREAEVSPEIQQARKERYDS